MSDAGEGELKKYSWEEIKDHQSSGSPWLVVHDKVYDVTDFLEEVSVEAIARGERRVTSLPLSRSILVERRY